MTDQCAKIYAEPALSKHLQKLSHRMPVDIDLTRVCPFADGLKASIYERRERRAAMTAKNCGNALIQKILLFRIGKKRKMVIRIGIHIYKTRREIQTKTFNDEVGFFSGKFSDRGNFISGNQNIRRVGRAFTGAVNNFGSLNQDHFIKL